MCQIVVVDEVETLISEKYNLVAVLPNGKLVAEMVNSVVGSS